MRVTSRTGSARRIWGILKKSVSWVLPREKTVGFRLLAEARPVALWRVPHVLGGGGADGKASIERLCISLPFVETFNSKVIKGFVPELRSRYVFFCVSGFLCSMYICYEHSMYVSHIRIMGMVNIYRNNHYSICFICLYSLPICLCKTQYRGKYYLKSKYVKVFIQSKHYKFRDTANSKSIQEKKNHMPKFS